MEFATIEREVFVDASPQVVFDVVSSPDHVKQWWPEDARYDPSPGATGELVFGEHHGDRMVVSITVVDARPPRMFSFRWTHPAGEEAGEGNSLLVRFDLTPMGGGTLLRMTETGFRAMGWDESVLEHEYNDHVSGWEFYLPRLASYAATLEVRS